MRFSFSSIERQTQYSKILARSMASTSSSKPERNPRALMHNPIFIKRSTYKWFYALQTRFSDNDQYGHVNVSKYLSFASYVNAFLIEMSGHDITSAGRIRDFTVETGMLHRRPLQYPRPVLVGLAVGDIGNSSVTYVVGFFDEDISRGKSHSEFDKKGEEFISRAKFQRDASAVGYLVEVFVDAETEKPIKIPTAFRTALASIFVSPDSKL